MTVTAGEGTGGAAPSSGGRLFGILCDVSGSMEGGKIVAAKAALARLVELLPAECSFFIVAGSDSGNLVCPVTRADQHGKQHALQAISHMRAFGGTMISRWLRAALEQFATMPQAMRQAVLADRRTKRPQRHRTPLTDALARCEGVFQCDCRGVGTDWNVEQLRRIAGKLLGTTDIIPSPAEIEEDFRGILAKALDKTVSDVFSAAVDSAGRAREVLQGSVARDCGPDGPLARSEAQLREYPTGAWARANRATSTSASR